VYANELVYANEVYASKPVYASEQASTESKLGQSFNFDTLRNKPYTRQARAFETNTLTELKTDETIAEQYKQSY
jgi:hypothetical protein